MSQKAYRLYEPRRLTSGVVFASPHSGCAYPAALIEASVLDERAIRSSEDAFVDTLFDCAPDFGAPLLAATAPRAFVDLNRAADELDPALIEGVRRSAHNPRVASGLGVVPRVVANGRAIYRGKIARDEAMERLDTVWRPYHARLQALLDTAQARFGEAVLIDCHSMPHEAVCGTMRGGRRAEIVVGDRFGASAGLELVERIESIFAASGLSVARNAPFAGAFTTQHYGRPVRGQHAIQIEIDRAIYMDEATITPNANFDPFRRLLRGVIAEIAAIAGRDFAVRLAAE